MASAIWDEKEKRWRCRVMVDGRKKYFSSNKPGMAGKREVLRRARAFQSDAECSGDCSFAAEWSIFLQDVAARSSESNYNNVAQLGRLYILPVLGARKMSMLKLSEVQRCINSATKSDGSALSKKSCSNIKNALTSFINYARIDAKTDLIPTGLYIPQNRPTKGREILSVSDVARIFNEFDNEFYINYWRLLLATGARPGEILGLQWTDVDGFYIRIRRAINRDRKITDGKNQNARRDIPINSLIEDILEDQKKRTAYLSSPWIFPSPSGDMASQSTTYKSMKRISDALGVNVSPYSLRHCFVSLMASAAIPETYIKNIIGHSSAMPTYSGPYAHKIGGDDEKAAALIDNTLRKIL